MTDSLSDNIDRIAAAAGASDFSDTGPDEPPEPSAELGETPDTQETATETPAPVAIEAPSPAASEVWDPTKGFTEEELATPEGVRAAADKVRSSLSLVEKAWGELDGHAAAIRRQKEKQKNREIKFGEEKKHHYAFIEQLKGDVNALTNGNAETALRALGRLRNMDGAKALEELTLAVVHDGKRPKAEPSQEVLELRQELAAVREHLVNQKQEERVASYRQEAMAIGNAIDAGKYPILAKFLEKDASGTLGDLLDFAQYYKSSNRGVLDIDDFLSKNEAELAKDFAPRVSAPQGGRNGNSASPTVEGRPGETVSPSASSKSGSTRQLTDDERYREAAKLVPDAWLNSGSIS